MKKHLNYIYLVIPFLLLGCNNPDDINPIPTNDSFLPMRIGNYWEYDRHNMTHISDTIRINNNLFYKFQNIYPRGQVSIIYYRIDENQNLIGSNFSGSTFIEANFNASIGDTIRPGENGIILTEKSVNLRTFKHLSPRGDYFKTYIRGLGWTYVREDYPCRKIEIDEVTYHF